MGHLYFANLLTSRGRFDEAFEQFGEAIRLDPLSLVANAACGWSHYYARHYEEAVRYPDKALEMDPTYAIAHRIRGMALEKLGRFEEALGSLQRGAELSGATLYATLVAQALANAGRQEEARRALADLEEAAQRRYVGPYGLSAAYLAMGDRDRAFAKLAEALAQRSHWLTLLDVDPDFDTVRTDPRFLEISRKVVPQ
jgi:tetratricopeptide (TPR) repeat protein